jgi:hypothetical protein
MALRFNMTASPNGKKPRTGWSAGARNHAHTRITAVLAADNDSLRVPIQDRVQQQVESATATAHAGAAQRRSMKV